MVWFFAQYSSTIMRILTTGVVTSQNFCQILVCTNCFWYTFFRCWGFVCITLGPDNHIFFLIKAQKWTSLAGTCPFPKSDIPLGIHNDMSDYQLRVVVSQYQKPTTLFHRKLTDTHKIFTTTKKELLVMVKTLNQFSIFLLGKKHGIYLP